MNEKRRRAPVVLCLSRWRGSRVGSLNEGGVGRVGVVQESAEGGRGWLNRGVNEV